MTSVCTRLFFVAFKGAKPQDIEDIEEDIRMLMQIKEKRFQMLNKYTNELYRMVRVLFFCRVIRDFC
jgi:hypothetical protein